MTPHAAIVSRVRPHHRGRQAALILLGLLLAGLALLAQAQPPAGGDPAAALASGSAPGGFSVRVGPAPAPGGEGVLMLTGPVSPGAGLQWQRKGPSDPEFTDLFDKSTYHGARSASLRISATTTAMNGDQFRCVVLDASGSASSAEGTLVVGPPTVGILGGNHQATEAGRFNPQPFDLAVWDASGTQPLVDTSVTFTVESGGGQLAASNTGTPVLAPVLTLKTDEDGTVQAYYRQAAFPNLTSKIKATAGEREVIFETTSFAPAAALPLDTGRADSSGGPHSATTAATGKGRAAVSSASISGLAVLPRSNGKGRDKEDPVRALTTNGPQLVLRTRANEYYAVQLNDWKITSVPAP